MDLSGTGSVITPLLAIEREDRTGVLEFTAQNVATLIYARAGEIVYADSGTVSETLGRMLIRTGRLTEEQVAAVIRRMTDALVDEQPIRFGEVVIEYDFMSSDELEQALTQQVKEKLMGCVHRGDGRWAFIADDPRLEEVGSYVVSTRPMLIEAAAALPERRLESILELEENRYPEIVAPESVVAAEFELSDDETKLLRDLDGTSSVHFILSKSPASMMPLLAALILGGGIELKPLPSGSRQSSENRPIPPEFRTQRRAKVALPPEVTSPWTRPPVAPPSSGSDVGARESAAMTVQVPMPAPTRRSSRTHLSAPTDQERERAQAAFGRLKVDLDRRKPIENRKRWPEPKDDKERRLMAESAFHQGRVFLRVEEAARALPGLTRAHELCPTEPEYELYAKWAQILVNDEFKQDARRAEIQALATKIVKENRDSELGFAILGHCAMHDGKDDAALRFFMRATHLDPKLVDAARFARILSMRAGRPKPPATKPEIRKVARGLLDTPLDEIVPAILQKAADAVSRKKPILADETGPASAVRTPGEGAVAPPYTRTERPPAPSQTSTLAHPAFRRDLPLELEPSTVPHPPAPPLASPPFAALSSSPSFGDPAFGVYGQAPAYHPPAPAPAPKPRKRMLLLWAGSLILTAVVCFAIARSFRKHPAPPTAATPSEPASASTIPSALAAPSALPAASAGPVASAAPSGAPEPPPPASSAKTGTLRVRHARGHRIYLDGRNMGETGKDLVVPCGNHRLKVGSTGTTRPIVVPCGALLEVD